MHEDEYKKVLERITGFRKQIGKTQKDMSRGAAVSQAQVSRLESGENRYQAETLLEYKKQGMDIDYVITGETRRTGKVELLVEGSGITSDRERNELLALITWSLEIELTHMEETFEKETLERYRKQLELLRQSLENRDGSTLYKLRNMHELSQMEMSQQLAVGIKKYRKLEKGESEIDVELLWNACRKFQCSPTYLLDGQVENFTLLNEILGQLAPKEQEEFNEFVQMGIKMIRKSEM